MSFLSRCRNLINEEPVLLLEVGCGTGTNLAAGQEMGYEVFGIDSSETAIKLAGDRLVLDRQTNLRVGDFTALPWPDCTFDVVIDRAAMTHNAPSRMREALAEVARVMKPGGFLLFNPFSQSHSSAAFARETEFEGVLHMEEASRGYFMGLGPVSFVTVPGARRLLSPDLWTIVSLRESVVVEHLDQSTAFAHDKVVGDLRIVARRS